MEGNRPLSNKVTTSKARYPLRGRLISDNSKNNTPSPAEQ